MAASKARPPCLPSSSETLPETESTPSIRASECAALTVAVIFLAISSASAVFSSEPSGSFIRIDTSFGLPNCWMIGSP